MTKKKIIIISCISLLILIFIIGLCIYFSTRIVEDNSGFTLKENVNAEVYSKVEVSDFLETIEGKIVEEDSIDTEELGEQEISFVYLNKENKKRRGRFNINVVDQTEPLIWLGSSYSLPIGSTVDLESEILCADNYDENPTCRIKGDYDLNQEGTYKLEYEAIDSSNNKENVEFTLYVYEPKQSSSSGSSSTSSVKENTLFSDVLKEYKTEETEVGIDVSVWQEDIDFKKVKEAGASFVMIRVGYQKGIDGEYVLDSNFKTNIENALANHLDVGVYFYSYANSNKEAKEQAQWVLKQIKEYDLTLPVVFDWECYSSFNTMELSLFGLNSIAESFLSEIKEKGYDTMIYASKNYLNAIWTYQQEDVWLAHYTEKTDYEGEYKMWQLCSDGKIDGISTDVDIDILYK